MKLFCLHLLLLSVADASDPVLLQYTELPYPDFPQIYLQMEKSHYSDENRQVVVYSKRFCTNYVEVVCISQSQGPFVVSPALTLENLNHYLFSGRENFESNFRVGRSLTHTWQYFQKQLYLFCCHFKGFSCWRWNWWFYSFPRRAVEPHKCPGALVLSSKYSSPWKHKNPSQSFDLDNVMAYRAWSSVLLYRCQPTGL